MLKPVRLAFIVALTLGLLALVGTLSGPYALVQALIYFLAAAGLWRRSVWCGFGPALWLVAQTLLALVVALEGSDSLTPEQLGTLLIGALIYVVAAWMFYRAGRSLVAAGSERPVAAA